MTRCPPVSPSPAFDVHDVRDVRGNAAVITGLRKRSALLVLSGTILLSACSSIGGFVGAASGIATGAVTTNPAIGVGVGIATKAATDQLVAVIMRDMQRREQDRIAYLAGTMPLGSRQPWQIHHVIPFNDEHGEVQAVANIDNALAPCREVLFSVIAGSKKAPTENWFTMQTCQQPDGAWQWASAEPAVARWGNLQ